MPFRFPGLISPGKRSYGSLSPELITLLYEHGVDDSALRTTLGVASNGSGLI
jgi:hypothetical protein